MPGIQLEGSKTLGTQPGGAINSSYFWQDNGINKIQLQGESQKLADLIPTGAVIDVKISFSDQKVNRTA